jgi:SAM-dependent methyltransferase
MNQIVDRLPVWDPLNGRTLSPELDSERLHTCWARRDALSAARLVQVFQEMGAFTRSGQRRVRGSLAAELGVTTTHTALFEVLLDLVVASGLLAADGQDLVATGAVAALASRDLAAEWAQLKAAHPEVTAQLTLLEACLAEYPRMLRGEVKPLSVLFPGWSMELVDGVYRGEPVSERLNDIVAQAVAERVAARIGSGPSQILEVGAGTGGTTLPILQTLTIYGGRYAYTYTDISTSFLRYARQRLAAEHPSMRFDRLNVEEPPFRQGFEKAGYDVVVAANVLHATRDLRNTLRQVTDLVAPGGRLVLREITTPLMFVTLSFGLLEGWWIAEDDLRIPGSPLAGEPTWTTLLAEAGFSRVAALSPVKTDGTIFGQHVIVAER